MMDSSIIDPLAAKDLFAYVDSSEYDLFLNKDRLPYAMLNGGIYICLKGEGEVIINENKYHLQPQTMCIAFPGTIIQYYAPKSEDLESYVLVLNMEFMNDLNIPSANTVYMSMRENPCINLSEEQQASIMQVCEMMHNKDSRRDHPYHAEINAQMLRLLCYELAGVYASRLPVRREPCTRQDAIFRKFLSLLATDYAVSREVQYYADKLDITPKYLTVVTRQVSGRSAADWIMNTVMTNAKALLQTTRLSVQEISNRLNFANPSFFGQYFLRHSGLTPKEFRRSKM